MKEFVKDTKFQKKSKERLELIESIVEEYQSKDFTLSVRQIYYQLISRYTDKFDIGKGIYTSVVGLVKKGRYAALIDWEMVVDRHREVKKRTHWETLKEFIKDAAHAYHNDYWKYQKTYCEIWVEKKALIDIVWKAAYPYDVSCYPCTGYNSTTGMKDGADRFLEQKRQGKNCVLFYIGDHDPSGINMTQDIQKRMNEFFNASDLCYEYETFIDIQRIALNIDQIKKYKLPPNWVKVHPNKKKYADTRAEDYIKEFGTTSWEVDALKPEVLTELVENAILSNLDQKLFEKAKSEERNEKQKFLSLDQFI